MLLHPTLSQLDQLGLVGMAKAFKDLTDNPEAKTLDHAEWLGLLLDREATERQDRRLKSRLRNAKLRYSQACVEDINFTKDRGLDRRLITDLAAGHWLREHHSLLLVGACGCGKTWLSCALGQKAARLEFSVLYHRLPKLFADLALARDDGRYPRLFRSLCRAHGRASTLVTSQIPIDRWYDIIAEPTMADAILDRLVHNAHKITLKGESMRKRNAENLDDNTND